MNYQSFIFEDYDFNQESKRLSLKYSFDGSLSFTEEYFFDFDFVEFDRSATRTIYSSVILYGRCFLL